MAIRIRRAIDHNGAPPANRTCYKEVKKLEGKSYFFMDNEHSAWERLVMQIEKDLKKMRTPIVGQHLLWADEQVYATY
jgi:hypothetical protein